MPSKFTLNLLNVAADRLVAAKAEALKSWVPYCCCLEPGEKVQCLDCVYFWEFIQKLQQQIHPAPEKVFAIKLPPAPSLPYSKEVRNQCLELYQNGYSLQKIKQLTGVNNFRVMRKWLKEEGLLKQASPEEQQHCIDLYLQGKTPLEIEEITQISAELIRNWVFQKGLSRPKNHYSDEQIQLALSMYVEDCSFSEIEEATKIPTVMIRNFAHQAKVRRPNKPIGRPPVYSSDFRQNCLELLETGKTPPQIEELLGVSADTVRKWKKEAEERRKE